MSRVKSPFDGSPCSMISFGLIKQMFEDQLKEPKNVALRLTMQ
jgi:hypothetical protein